ncbi:hypothetical protein [Zobellella taiwanensis]
MENGCDVIIDDVLNKISFMLGKEVFFDRDAFDVQENTALYNYMDYYDYESWDFGKKDEYGSCSYSLDKAVKSVAYVLQEHYERIESEYLNDIEGFTLSDDALNELIKHARLLHIISRETLSAEVKAWVDEQMELASQIFEATKQ